MYLRPGRGSWLFCDDLKFDQFIDEVPGGELDAVSHWIPPSSLIKYLSKNKPEYFARTFGATREELRWFWGKVLASDDGRQLVADHPLLSTVSIGNLETMIPLFVHEDAGPYSKTKSCTEVLWGPLLASRTATPDLASRFITFTHIKWKDAEIDKADAAWQCFFADLHRLFRGKCEDGSNAATVGDVSFQFALIFGKSDMEQGVIWGLPSCLASTVISAIDVISSPAS